MLFGITLIIFVTLALFTPAILAAVYSRGMDVTDTLNCTPFIRRNHNETTSEMDPTRRVRWP